MAPRQPPAVAWYSSALDPPNVSEASLARLRRMAMVRGVNGAKVFKAGSATPEGQGSTFYPLFVSAIAAGLESPLAGAEDGPAKLLPFLVRALQDVALGLGPTAEAEARVLSSAALTQVLTHIYLRDPGVDLDSLLEPVSGERAAAAAEAVKGRAEALLGKFRAFSTKPKQGAADPTAP